MLKTGFVMVSFFVIQVPHVYVLILNINNGRTTTSDIRNVESLPMSKVENRSICERFTAEVYSR